MKSEINDFFYIEGIDYDFSNPENDLNVFEPVFSFQSVRNHIFLIDCNYEKLKYIFFEKEIGIKIREKYSCIKSIMKNLNNIKIDEETKEDIVFNLNSVINHNFFFSLIRKGNSALSLTKNIPFFGISKALLNEIEKTFFSMNGLEEEIINLISSNFFIGWLWMVFDRSEKKLKLITTKNNDSLIFVDDNKINVLFSIDFWEHSYLLDFFSFGKKEYTSKLLKFLFDWEYISKRFSSDDSSLNNITKTELAIV